MQVKLFIFQSVEDARRFEGERIESSLPDPALPKPKKVYNTKKRAEKKAIKERIVRKSKGFGIGSQPMSNRVCSACGEKGHRKDNCPNSEAAHEKKSSVLTDDELHAAIQGLKEDGLDSVRIAQKLKISLKTVNENW